MDREELKKILPHREPMLLLDEAFRKGETAVGRYDIRGDEFFLQGHFPGNPVVPGVILCEILAQSACVLLADKTEGCRETLYTGINKARFRSPVRPGDRVEAECRITRSKGPFFFAEGKVRVGERVCATAEFSVALM